VKATLPLHGFRTGYPPSFAGAEAKLLALLVVIFFRPDLNSLANANNFPSRRLYRQHPDVARTSVTGSSGRSASPNGQQ
jgi:hypothetical protein